jgi:hypothetical protein
MGAMSYAYGMPETSKGTIGIGIGIGMVIVTGTIMPDGPNSAGGCAPKWLPGAHCACTGTLELIGGGGGGMTCIAAGTAGPTIMGVGSERSRNVVPATGDNALPMSTQLATFGTR